MPFQPAPGSTLSAGRPYQKSDEAMASMSKEPDVVNLELRKDVYHGIGGHNPDLAAADDYELCVRTFLRTRMILLRKFCYIQYYNESGNTQRLRNKDIQRLTRAVSEKYDARIHQRFVDLGVYDFTWDAGRNATDWSRANPVIEPHCSLIVG